MINNSEKVHKKLKVQKIKSKNLIGLKVNIDDKEVSKSFKKFEIPNTACSNERKHNHAYHQMDSCVSKQFLPPLSRTTNNAKLSDLASTLYLSNIRLMTSWVFTRLVTQTDICEP